MDEQLRPMSELGALLELIHDAHSQVTTLEAEYRDWNRPRPSLEVHVKRSELGYTHAHWAGAGPFPATIATTRRIWVKAPDSVRVEIIHQDRLVRLGVLNGERWWRWDPDWGPISGEPIADEDVGWAPPPPLLTPPLVNPVALLATLRFEGIGSAVRAGREVMTAWALPRRRSPTGRGLRYELEFDVQHGTILRRATHDEGHMVSLTEAIAVAYGGGFHPEHFVFASPDRQPACSIRHAAMTPEAAYEAGSTH